MKKIIILFVITLFTLNVKAESYEGFIGDAYAVWFDLTIPELDGKVEGSYFYKKYGEDIPVNGIKKGTLLALEEFAEREKVTGIIECRILKDSIVGTWKKPGRRSGLSLNLHKSDPQFRIYAEAMNGSNLHLAGGGTLYGELNSGGYTDEDGKPVNGPLDLQVHYRGKGVFSTSFHWAFFGAYLTAGITYHTFDMSTGKEIVLWKEIDGAKMEAFNRYLAPKIEPVLAETRKEYPDSEWAGALSTWMQENEFTRIRDSVGEFFILRDIRDDAFLTPLIEGTNYYIDSTAVHLDVSSYFDLPHVIQSMDVSGEVEIPFKDLMKYLTKNSVLRKLP